MFQVLVLRTGPQSMGLSVLAYLHTANKRIFWDKRIFIFANNRRGHATRNSDLCISPFMQRMKFQYHCYIHSQLGKRKVKEERSRNRRKWFFEPGGQAGVVCATLSKMDTVSLEGSTHVVVDFFGTRSDVSSHHYPAMLMSFAQNIV